MQAWRIANEEKNLIYASEWAAERDREHSFTTTTGTNTSSPYVTRQSSRRATAWSPHIEHRTRQQLAAAGASGLGNQQQQQQRAPLASPFSRVRNNGGEQRKRRNSDPLLRTNTNNNNNIHNNYSFYGGARPLLTTVDRPAPRAKKPLRCDRGILIALVHVAVIIVTTAHLVINTKYDFVIQRDAFFDWNQILFPPNLAPTDNVDQVVHVYTQAQALQTTQRIAHFYFHTLRNNTLPHFEYLHYRDTKHVKRPLPMTLTTVLWRVPPANDAAFDADTISRSYSLTPEDELGPLDNMTEPERVDFFDRLQSIAVTFRLRTIVFSYTRLCLDWSVSYAMNARSRGELYGNLKANDDFCPRKDQIGETSASPSALLVFDYLIIVFSACSLLLGWIDALAECGCWQRFCNNHGGGGGGNHGWLTSPISRSYQLLSVQQTNNSNNNVSVASGVGNDYDDGGGDDDDNVVQLVCRCKKSLLSRRWWMSQLTDVSNLLASSFELAARLNFDHTLGDQYVQFFFGLGACLAWMRIILLVKYLGQPFYVFVRTMQDATPFLMRFLLGVLPVFFGFVMFGVTVFATTTRKFRNVDLSAMSLFAILNGDMIADTYHDLMHTQRFLGQVYVYMVILLFMWVVSKLALAAVEYYFFMNVPATDVITYDDAIASKVGRDGDGQRDGSDRDDGDDDHDDGDDDAEEDEEGGKPVSLFFSGKTSSPSLINVWLRVIRREHKAFARVFRIGIRRYVREHFFLIGPEHIPNHICTNIDLCSACKCALVYQQQLDRLKQLLFIGTETTGSSSPSPPPPSSYE